MIERPGGPVRCRSRERDVMRGSVHDGCAACQNVAIHYLDHLGAGHPIRQSSPQDRRRSVPGLDTGNGVGEGLRREMRGPTVLLDQSALGAQPDGLSDDSCRPSAQRPRVSRIIDRC